MTAEVNTFINTIVKALKDHYTEGSDAAGEYLCRVITKALENPPFQMNAFMSIPPDWEYSETRGGDNPTKETFVYTWLYEEIVTRAGWSI